MDSQLHTFPNQQDLIELQKKIPQLDVSSIQVIFTLLRTAGELSSAFNTYLANYGLSQGKIKILLLLYQQPEKGLLPSELAVCSNVTRGTITGLIDGLEKDGFVERVHHVNDRRMVTIKLTALGEQLLHQVLPKHFTDVRNLINRISAAEIESLMSTLGKLMTAIPTMHE